MDPQKPFSSHYGAIVGTTALGGKATKLIILANLNLYMKLLDSALKSNDILKQEEAQKCHGALLVPILNVIYLTLIKRAVGLHLRNKMNNGGQKRSAESSNPEGKQDKSEEDTPMKEATESTPSKDLNTTYQELFELFGESLIPFVSNERSVSDMYQSE